MVVHARRKKRRKRGGGRRRFSLEAVESMVQRPSEDLVALDEALMRLTAHDPIKAEGVKLRFFTVLTIGSGRGVGPFATVERYGTYARTWLHFELTGENDPEEL